MEDSVYALASYVRDKRRAGAGVVPMPPHLEADFLKIIPDAPPPDDNDDDCGECKKDVGAGPLLCCDGCPASMHSECAGLNEKEAAALEKWFCPACFTRLVDDAVLDNVRTSGSKRKPNEDGAAPPRKSARCSKADVKADTPQSDAKGVASRADAEVETAPESGGGSAAQQPMDVEAMVNTVVDEVWKLRDDLEFQEAVAGPSGEAAKDGAPAGRRAAQSDPPAQLKAKQKSKPKAKGTSNRFVPEEDDEVSKAENTSEGAGDKTAVEAPPAKSVAKPSPVTQKDEDSSDVDLNESASDAGSDSVSWEGSDDSKDNVCKKCGNGGEMICCETCPAAMHFKCAGLTRKQANLIDEWFCPDCKTKKSKSFSRKNIRAVKEEDTSTKALVEAESARYQRIQELRRKAGLPIDQPDDEDDDVDVDEGGQAGAAAGGRKVPRIRINQLADEKPLMVHPRIAAGLKPHQIEGVRFMFENVVESRKAMKSAQESRGCILAHNMGLGKTVQVIALLAVLLKESYIKKALIVLPVNVIHNWKKEWEMWLGEDSPAVYASDDHKRGDHKARIRLMKKWHKEGGIYLLGYEQMRNMVLGRFVPTKQAQLAINQCLLDPGPDLIVLDEGHRLSNPKSELNKMFDSLKTRRRIILTGYPLQNNLMEYYAMIDFIFPNYLGTPQQFRNRFMHPIRNGQMKDSTPRDVAVMKRRSHVLFERLKSFVHRRDTSILFKDLPPKQEYVIYLRLTNEQTKIYQYIVNRYICSMSRNAEDDIFSAWHNLMRVTNHPDLMYRTLVETNKSEDGVPAASSTPNVTSRLESLESKEKLVEALGFNNWSDLISTLSFKITAFFQILDAALKANEKVLLFTQSVEMLDLMEDLLACRMIPDGAKGAGHFWENGLNYLRVDGKISGHSRHIKVTQFSQKSSKYLLFLSSTKAGGIGVNLVAASRVVILDVTWNPVHDVQALFRTYRYGQTKPVFVYRLVAAGTMEQKIYERQILKEQLAKRISDNQQMERHFYQSDVMDLFRFNHDPPNPDFDYANFNPLTVVDDRDVENVKADPIVMRSLSSKEIAVVRVHCRESLLEDQPEEQLSEREKDVAWQEFKQSESLYAPPRAQSSLAYQEVPVIKKPTVVLKTQDELDLAIESLKDVNGLTAEAREKARQYLVSQYELNKVYEREKMRALGYDPSKIDVQPR